MLSRIRKSMAHKEQGFTLIELLVVIIIIGILAAIAIPVFLNQRRKGVDASLKSDLRNAAQAMETYFVDKQVYPANVGSVAGGGATTGGDLAANDQDVKITAGNTVTRLAAGAAAGTYCLIATNSRPSSGKWSYDSDKGGLLTPVETPCS